MSEPLDLERETGEFEERPKNLFEHYLHLLYREFDGLYKELPQDLKRMSDWISSSLEHLCHNSEEEAGAKRLAALTFALWKQSNEILREVQDLREE